MEVKPGFKQTEVGVIPEEWETHRLGELVQGSRSIRYGIVQPGKFEPTGCFMLRSQDYSKGWAGPDGMHKVSAHLENQYKNARIRHNDLIMTVVGAGIGQVAFAPAWLDGAICSRSTARIAVDETKAAPSFVKAFLESPIGKRQIMDCQKEGAQPVVSCLDLAKFFVACPPPPEQRAIAGALSDVDALLGALDQLIAKKRDLKQAAMQQLLTGQTRLPGFHGEWEVKKLGEIAEPNRINVNPANFPDQMFAHFSLPAFDAGKIPVIEPGAAIGSNKFRVPQGAVLVSRLNPRIPRVWSPEEIPSEAIASTEFLVLTPREGFSRSFLFVVCSSPSFCEQMELAATGTTGSHQRMSPSGALSLKVSVPKDVAEQTAIAEVLTDMDAELAALEQRRAKTRALKQGMMQELLTGRTRLA